MKFYFPLSEWSLGNRPCWLEHLAICLNSLKANTTLKPVMIWRGAMDHHVCNVVRSYGCGVVESFRSYDDILTSPSFVPGRPVEVSFGTFMKMEAPYHAKNTEETLIVGDVDTLWLRQPIDELYVPKYPIQAGPRMWQGEERIKGFNAGMMIMSRWEMVSSNLLERSREFIQRTNAAGDEYVLNQLYKESWGLLDWEQRAFWPMPSKTPAVVHFHGPKLDQIRDLEKECHQILHDPEKTYRDTMEFSAKSAVHELFWNGEPSLVSWARIASPYTNSPMPILEELTK